MQLNVAVKPDALQDIGGQVLVWVMTEPAFEAAEVEVGAWRGVGIARDAALRPTVPHSVTSQLRGFGLTSGNDPAATTVDVRWGDPRLLLVSGGREVVERVPESPLGLSPSSSDGMMSRMARQAGAVIEGGRVLEQFARYRGGVQRLHLSAQPSKRVSPPATLSSGEVMGASSKPNMRRRASHAGAVRPSAGRWATLCAEEAPKSNWAPSGAASVARGGWATEHSHGGEGARGGAGARGTPERASERGVPWSAARVHHAEVASRARHARR